MNWTLLIVLNVLAVLMTFAGGLLPLSKSLMSRQLLWRLFALRSGILLSVTFLEIYPEAWSQNPATAGWGALGGFALFFLLESVAMVDACPEYLEECPVHLLGWGALGALSLHSLIDGFNLSVSFSAGDLAGASVGAAIALHKIADGFTLTSLFREAGFSGAKSLWALLLVAVATPAGSLLHAMGAGSIPSSVNGALLGFAAGSFFYIGAADILPRLHRSHDRMTPVLFTVGLLSIGVLMQLAGGH